MDITLPIQGANSRVKLFGLAIGPLVAAGTLIFADLSPGNPAVTATAGVALWMAIWWITEAVPLYLTALIPVTLFPALGVADGREVSAHYFNHVIFLFLGGFMVAVAMRRWELHRRIALLILSLFGARPMAALAGFMAASAFLSMWISNTAATMMMVPIIIALVDRFDQMAGETEGRRYAVGLLLGAAYAASIGGTATLVGTPPNPVFVKIYAISFPGEPEISFAQWFLFALPVALTFLFLVWLYLGALYCRNAPSGVGKEEFLRQYRELGRMSYEERVVLFVFCSLAFLWLTRSGVTIGDATIPGWGELFVAPAYFNDGTVAIAVASLLFLLPSKARPDERIANWETIKELPWGIVILFGGGFALAAGFRDSGLSLWVGERLAMVGSFHPALMVFFICLFCAFLTELTSNTATAQILLPVMAALATAIGVHPLVLMAPATIAFSFAFMLPVATPPNAIVFGAGRITVADMAKAGLALNLLGALLLTAAAFWLLPLFFGVTPTTPVTAPLP